MRYGGFFCRWERRVSAGLLITSITFPVLVRRLGVETYSLWSYVGGAVRLFSMWSPTPDSPPTPFSRSQPAGTLRPISF